MTEEKQEKKLTELLAEVMAEVGYVQKDGKNDFQKYRYASAEAVLKKVNAALSSRGICFETQSELLHYVPPADGGKGKTRAVAKITGSFRRGQENCIATGIGEGSDSGDKAVAKANTAALKYLVAAAFLISWGDDPEADTSTDKDAAHAKKPAARAKRTKKSGAATVADQDSLGLSIVGASTLEALEKTKPAIKALRESDKVLYAELRAVYTARENELKEGDK